MVGLGFLLFTVVVVAAWAFFGATVAVYDGFMEFGLPSGLALGGALLFALTVLILLRRRS